MKKKGGTIRVGIGGWTYEPWQGTFYPEGHPRKQELEYASRQFTSIEINSTYYGAQKPESFAKWYEQTPDTFIFSVKAPRYATQRKVLADAGKTIERFLSGGLIQLKHKLGPINWQFMPSKAFDSTDFESFLRLLPQDIKGLALQHAVEVRHDSFRTPEFIALARRYGVAVVMGADSEYPFIADTTAPFVYVRLMGTQEEEPLGYPAATLDLWAQRAKTWSKGGTPDNLTRLAPALPDSSKLDVYIYVIGGHKVSNPCAAKSLIMRMA
ncbi:DUF72 domain-containing protein [Candidimonas sp. SYP-B2681]|uniref:DUF72 domain-containing protein n=1 Tax=Candidimonas sp. SYP-B2681 TaxID=2497686 RepID=UPI000F878101|nr:DUF72 domain-containing protein [Candidimonas sp. SYP-B2681]RTZ47827.1 DUF72 domain-containing protein [Candidimonas sp. SYP-B2681]